MEQTFRGIHENVCRREVAESLAAKLIHIFIITAVVFGSLILLGKIMVEENILKISEFCLPDL